MTDPRIVGFLINAALFLGLLGAAGIAQSNHLVVLAALSSAGCSAISYLAQIEGVAIAKSASLVSWLLAIAGFALLAVGRIG